MKCVRYYILLSNCYSLLVQFIQIITQNKYKEILSHFFLEVISYLVVSFNSFSFISTFLIDQHVKVLDSFANFDFVRGWRRSG